MITVMHSNKGPFQSVKTTWYSTGLSFARHKRNNLMEETVKLPDEELSLKMKMKPKIMNN